MYALAYPSGVDEVVNTTELYRCFVDHVLDACLICYIDLDNRNPEIISLRRFALEALVGCRISGLEVYVCADDDVHAAGCHCQGDLPADTAPWMLRGQLRYSCRVMVYSIWEY